MSASTVLESYENEPEVVHTTTPTWSSVLDLDGGYNGVASVVWHHLDPLSVIRLSKTCSLLAASLKLFYGTRWRLESLLAVFVEHAGAFRRRMRRAGAVIAEDAAAKFVYGDIEGLEDLNLLTVFVPADKASILADHLKSHESHLRCNDMYDMMSHPPFRNGRRWYNTQTWTSDKPRKRWIRLQPVESDALLEAAALSPDTYSSTFLTWDKAVCLFPSPSLTAPSPPSRQLSCTRYIPRKYHSAERTVFELCPSWHSFKADPADDATPLSKQKWPELHRHRYIGDSYSWLIPFGGVPEKEDTPSSLGLPGTSGLPERSYRFCFYSTIGVVLDHNYQCSSFHNALLQRARELSKRQSSESGVALDPTLSVAVPLSHRADGLPGILPRGDPHDYLVTSLHALEQDIQQERARERFKTDLHFCTFSLLAYDYSWTDPTADFAIRLPPPPASPPPPSESRRFFEHLVSARMEHLCLHWLVRTAAHDLPAVWSALSEPLLNVGAGDGRHLSPTSVRAIMRRISVVGPAPAYWRRYDDQLGRWYEEFRAGTRVPRRIESLPAERGEGEVFWCDAAESDRLPRPGNVVEDSDAVPSLQGIDLHDGACCRQWRQDYARFLTIVHQGKGAVQNGLKRSWEDASLESDGVR